MEKKIILILLIGFVARSSAQEASCEYSNLVAGYTCFINIFNPLGNEIDVVGGEHLEGFTNENVTRLQTRGAQSGLTTIVPEVICRQFPNLVTMYLDFIGITTITVTSFSSCANLINLGLYNNRISELPENAFASNDQLGYLDLDRNNISSLPENIFANLVNLDGLELRRNPLQTIPLGLFNSLTNLRFLYFNSILITELNPQWFAQTTNLEILYLYNNLITSFEQSNFETLTNLRSLDIGENPITQQIPGNTFDLLTNLQRLTITGLQLTEIDTAWFSSLSNLLELELYNNNLTTIPENSFEGLPNLLLLDLDFNSEISELPAGFLSAQTSLEVLFLSGTSIWFVNPQWFDNTPNLEVVFLDFNLIQDLPVGSFSNLNNLRTLGLWGNDIKTLERGYFGNLQNLNYLDLDENDVNGLDRRIFDDAFNLSIFYFFENTCASGLFSFVFDRDGSFRRLERCFRNFLFAVETVTEGGNAYQFYRFSEPGMSFRVEASQDVHISLNPVNFEAVPRVEIHIGTNGNMRSRILIDGEETIVDISTPYILDPLGFNDFRIVHANLAFSSVYLVYQEGSEYPFMGFTTERRLLYNFVGIRTPGMVAPWTILPLDAQGN